jgi:hypothetical protein
MHGGLGDTVSGDDNGISEPNGETGGDDGVGCMGQVICIYPYVPLGLLLFKADSIRYALITYNKLGGIWK